MPAPKYKRVLLKISGEAFCKEGARGIDIDEARDIARQIQEAASVGTQVAIVVGGGNIIRGGEIAKKGISQATGDSMGMLATVINALALQDVLELRNLKTRVLSAISVHSLAEPYIRRRAVRHMEKGRVVVFAAGTGNPFFTTDTAAALRATEMNCDALLKATKVDGVYSDDPMHSSEAVRYDRLSYLDVLSRDLKVMDASAISLARENGVPILVFSIREPGTLAEVVAGRGRCTVIGEAEAKRA